MTVTHPANEYEALVNIVDRIAVRYPDVPEPMLFDLVADELTGFDRARMRTYIPTLVEGRVLRRLRDADAASPVA